MAIRKYLFFVLLFICKHLLAQPSADSGFIKYMESHHTSIDSIKIVPLSTPNNSLLSTINIYNTFVYEHKIKAYKWQLLSAQIIFFVVIGIVFAGIYLSYLQIKSTTRYFGVQERQSFTNNLTSIKETKEGEFERIVGPDNSREIQAQTTFEIGKEGLKISSAVIGLIILIVSIAFFYLYLRFAFSINE